MLTNDPALSCSRTHSLGGPNSKAGYHGKTAGRHFWKFSRRKEKRGHNLETFTSRYSVLEMKMSWSFGTSVFQSPVQSCDVVWQCRRLSLSMKSLQLRLQVRWLHSATRNSAARYEKGAVVHPTIISGRTESRSQESRHEAEPGSCTSTIKITFHSPEAKSQE